MDRVELTIGSLPVKAADEHFTTRLISTGSREDINYIGKTANHAKEGKKRQV
jgi:hypothetical protein